MKSSFMDELKAASKELSTQFIDLIDSLSALHALMELDVKQPNERILARQALMALMQNQDIERCSLFLLEGDLLLNVTGLDWNDCEAAQSADFFTRVQHTQAFRLGEGIIGQAAATRTLLHCPDCRQDERFIVKDGASYVPGCVISSPVQLGGEVMGVLNISHPQAHYFKVWHERLIGVYCALLALMLKNNRLVRHLESEVQARTSELEQSLAEARALKQRYETLSLLDELTELFNRRYFLPHAHNAFARAMRYDEPLSILVLDLDLFKAINDNYGHAAGDEVLSGFAAMLRHQVREVDILARLGGEEFVIAATATPGEQAVRFAERICQATRELTIDVNAFLLRVTVSIGVAALDHEAARREKWTLETLLARADQALYRAKRDGRDRVVLAGSWREPHH